MGKLYQWAPYGYAADFQNRHVFGTQHGNVFEGASVIINVLVPASKFGRVSCHGIAQEAEANGDREHQEEENTNGKPTRHAHVAQVDEEVIHLGGIHDVVSCASFRTSPNQPIKKLRA
jgi:hypothetical protein